jgi:hypothetical protein
VTQLEWEWDWETLELLSSCGYVSVSVKRPGASRPLKVMRRSGPAKRSRQPFWTRDVLVAREICWVVSQSAVAIELA